MSCGAISHNDTRFLEREKFDLAEMDISEILNKLRQVSIFNKIQKIVLQQIALLAVLATVASADKRPQGYQLREPIYRSEPSSNYHSAEKQVNF